MISAKTILLIVALTGICSAGVVKRGADKCSSSQEDREKGQELFYGCFEEVTGKKFSMDLFEEDDSDQYFSDTNMDSIKICMMKKLNYLSEDEQTFHSETMKANVDSINASDNVKQEIKAGIDKCVANNDDARAAVSCAADIMKEQCS